MTVTLATFQSPMGNLHLRTYKPCRLRWPRSNRWVEGAGISEHKLHVGDIGHGPITNELVEGTGTKEHAMHAGDTGDIPIASWSIAVRLVQPRHVGDDVSQEFISLSCMLHAQPQVLDGSWVGKQSAHATQ